MDDGFRSEQSIQDDRRKYSYKQALPIIGELAQDEAFVEAINQMKKEQNDLEKLLHSQRREITTMHEGKVKVAKQRANIVGQPITRHDALMLNDNWKKALAKFDREKVLPLWDDLVSRQQQKLEKMGVPTMFETQEQDEREKQQKLVKVMENLV
ncbi:hypothetical protein CYLTODRAFT_345247 [Cylindrobasidium torrendii FP15055 ss-10]|uniref:Uncharacterized protein n=1 Tax=Cylindrobasidium torrendii FP15055 ss-10 TaxID=1314674 RepID=A0A0D7BMT7_9AGAR|nr:hypothetical protein CYLTODRAFT_345247 [Cylindrobasidium torrendii FP15055 ss-10]